MCTSRPPAWRGGVSRSLPHRLCRIRLHETEVNSRMRDKTPVQELLWFYRLRQAGLFEPESTCGASGAPWQCVSVDGGVPGRPNACVTRKAGLCSSVVATPHGPESPPTGNTGVTHGPQRTFRK